MRPLTTQRSISKRDAWRHDGHMRRSSRVAIDSRIWHRVRNSSAGTKQNPSTFILHFSTRATAGAVAQSPWQQVGRTAALQFSLLCLEWRRQQQQRLEQLLVAARGTDGGGSTFNTWGKQHDAHQFAGDRIASLGRLRASQTNRWSQTQRAGHAEGYAADQWDTWGHCHASTNRRTTAYRGSWRRRS